MPLTTGVIIHVVGSGLRLEAFASQIQAKGVELFAAAWLPLGQLVAVEFKFDSRDGVVTERVFGRVVDATIDDDAISVSVDFAEPLGDHAPNLARAVERMAPPT